MLAPIDASMNRSLDDRARIEIVISAFPQETFPTAVASWGTSWSMTTGMLSTLAAL